jgi:hypothetical protein
LSEIQIRAGLVTSIHGLHETTLGPETVSNDAIDEQDENFNDDFDDGADETPVL